MSNLVHDEQTTTNDTDLFSVWFDDQDMDEDRVSLHPLHPEDALRGLLATPKNED